MKFALFTHSILSDWNHGNAHFLRGISDALIAKGHDILIYEPEDAWSLQNLVLDHGPQRVQDFYFHYPALRGRVRRYDEKAWDVNAALSNVDVVLVHEWNTPFMVKTIGDHRRQHGHYRLFFHDTHHRMVTQPEAMSAFDLRGYDGVLAFGQVIAELYLHRGLAQRAWTWHEAADVKRFKPLDGDKAFDLTWIGNWGDGERSAELREFLVEPLKELKLRAAVHGVRYSDSALNSLREAGIVYKGWAANFHAPAFFAESRFTVHVPRSPYVRALPGIPTIRMFEALACGIPLISAPWNDSEGLFRVGEDYLLARDAADMKQKMQLLVNDPEMGMEMAEQGRKRILENHTCSHRVDELMQICGSL